MIQKVPFDLDLSWRTTGRAAGVVGGMMTGFGGGLFSWVIRWGSARHPDKTTNKGTYGRNIGGLECSQPWQPLEQTR